MMSRKGQVIAINSIDNRLIQFTKGDTDMKVLQRQIPWPEDLDDTCRDLIEGLMQMEPKDRLGAIDTKNDITALMNHEFFEGIDFDSDLSMLGIKQILEETKSQE